MISLDQVIAFAVRDPTVMDQLGPALRNDLVTSNPFQHRIVEFADDFLLQRRKLPGNGDFQMWLEGLPEGMIRDGTREALGRLLAIDVRGHDPAYFAAQAIEQLRRGAAQVAQARLNSVAGVAPEMFAALAQKLADIQPGALSGLARLEDVDVWASAQREDDLTPTGYPSLDALVGGYGKELWIIFADSGVGKSMWLQNAATSVALRGKRVLHVTLELGIRPQIRRYYRQIAQATNAEMAAEPDEVKRRLRHWFRMAAGSVYLLEFPAHSLTVDALHRTIERAGRLLGGGIDFLVLDYLDLLDPMDPTDKGARRSAYEDLGRLTHRARALAAAFDLTVVTASQAVRRPERAGRLTMRDMGDSYKKVQGADVLLSLVQTPEEEEVRQGRLGILKVRDSGGRGHEVPLYINRELSIIAEESHPNTQRLMKQLGHVPSPKAAPLAGGVSQ